MMAQSWGPSTTSTTTGTSYHVVFTTYEDTGTAVSAWTWSLREHVEEFKQVLTEKQRRDLAAARAHRATMAAAVRARPGPTPPVTRSRHGHYAGPRMSCHTGTRTR